MIITEMSEALLYGIETSQEELDRENVKLAKRLRFLLDEDTALHEIPSGYWLWTMSTRRVPAEVISGEGKTKNEAVSK